MWTFSIFCFCSYFCLSFFCLIDYWLIYLMSICLFVCFSICHCSAPMAILSLFIKQRSFYTRHFSKEKNIQLTLQLIIGSLYFIWKKDWLLNIIVFYHYFVSGKTSRRTKYLNWKPGWSLSNNSDEGMLRGRKDCYMFNMNYFFPVFFLIYNNTNTTLSLLKNCCCMVFQTLCF